MIAPAFSIPVKMSGRISINVIMLSALITRRLNVIIGFRYIIYMAIQSDSGPGARLYRTHPHKNFVTLSIQIEKRPDE